jgi:hypothetical protein
MLVSSLVAAAWLAGQMPIESHPQMCGGPLPNWSALPVVPPNSQARPRNVVEVKADGKLLWNGEPVLEEQVREYVALVAEISGTLTVLRVRHGANCADVKSLRQMIDSRLKCDAESCGEFDG